MGRKKLTLTPELRQLPFSSIKKQYSYRYVNQYLFFKYRMYILYLFNYNVIFVVIIALVQINLQKAQLHWKKI